MDNKQSDAVGLPRLCVWAVWFAVVIGLAQAAFIAVIRATTGRLILISPGVVWMAPLANAIVYVFAALILGLISSRLGRRKTILIAFTVFVFLALLGPILIVPGLNPYAALILAAGVSVQAARILEPRTSWFDSVARGSLPVLVCICIASALGLSLSKEVAAQAGEASLPAAGAGAPNVVLVVLDTVRAQSLGLHGYQRETSPRLDEFARTGVVFERALSTSPWTLPSHSSFFTGRQPDELSADWLRPLDKTHRTLAEVFQSHGYVTAGFVANLIYGTSESGLNRGFLRYSDFPATPAMIFRDSYLARALFLRLRGFAGETDPFISKRASDVNEEFVSWLKRRPRKPFFAFLNYFDAHSPYVVPPPFDTRFGSGGRQPYINLQQHWPPEQKQKFIDAYDSAVAYVDDQLGKLLTSLQAEGLQENTLIVITGDHGEQFGEHGLFDHANSLYRPLLHVPLVISLPGRVPEGKRVSDPVSLVDLPATILDLAGIEESELPGRSLARNWSAGDGPIFAMVTKSINMPEWLPASKGPLHSVILGGMQYILNGDGREELYDFDHDVAELNDLSTLAESRPALEAARRSLNAEVK